MRLCANPFLGKDLDLGPNVKKKKKKKKKKKLKSLLDRDNLLSVCKIFVR